MFCPLEGIIYPLLSLFICKWKAKNLHSKESQSICLLYAPQILFLKESSVFLWKLRISQAMLSSVSTVQYYIAIFTVERTLISEWSVYEVSEEIDIHLNQKPQ
jgi:hypothetical protein